MKVMVKKQSKEVSDVKCSVDLGCGRSIKSSVVSHVSAAGDGESHVSAAGDGSGTAVAAAKAAGRRLQVAASPIHHRDQA